MLLLLFAAQHPQTLAHLVNCGGVVLLNVPQDLDVIVLHKVDGHALRYVGSGGQAVGRWR